MIVAVTGANGFVGRHVCRALNGAELSVRALVRDPTDTAPIADAAMVGMPSLNSETDRDILRTALDGAEVVVHLAAHVHVMKADADDPAFHEVNVAGSMRLAEAAATAGVRRFVFMSSVKAVGERCANGPMTAATVAAPEDAYGRSKRAAELALREIAARTAMELVVLRPTFVYGWPPSGNFKTVITAVRKGLPLPLAAIDNRRDMIYVGNLADAVRHACAVPVLPDGPYFLSDHNPVSTPQLFRRVGRAFAKPARLFYIPIWLLRLAGIVTRRRAVIARLTESLEVDIEPFIRDAAWQPPYNMAEGLEACAEAQRAELPGQTATDFKKGPETP